MNNWPLSFPALCVLLAGSISTSTLVCAQDASAAAASSNAAPSTVPGATTTPMAQPPVVAPSATASGDTTPTAPEPTETTENPATYTVATGDTLWDLSHKFHTSVKKLKSLNHLTKNNLKPGQVLKIPPSKKSAPLKSTSVTHRAKKKEIAERTSEHIYLRAEPVQDFDIPASTFASCPVPVAADNGDADPVAAPDRLASATFAAPRATPVMAEPAPMAAPRAEVVAPELAETSAANYAAPEYAAPAVAAPASAPAPAKRADHGFFSFFYTPPPSPDWGTRFTQAARELGDRGLTYDEDWCPPGESHAWSMDCSNTTRYLYKVATGIELPRTASDQYYYLHLQNKAWDVPQTASGFADCNYLRQNLKPGDLLFWENTYRPERQPPITHVMVFLGTNARGNWIMAGSQCGSGGEHNRRDGGPDIYVFDPTKPCGGYSTWLGLVHHQGRFCAFGRPLEADKSKLAVAAND